MSVILGLQTADPENAVKIDEFIARLKRLKDLESPFTVVRLRCILIEAVNSRWDSFHLAILE